MINGEEAEDFAMTDLSEALSGPQGVEIAQDVLRRLEGAKSRVDGEMAAGLPFGQIGAFQAVSGALAASHAIVLATFPR